jgi:hypothetical protein
MKGIYLGFKHDRGIFRDSELNGSKLPELNSKKLNFGAFSKGLLSTTAILRFCTALLERDRIYLSVEEACLNNNSRITDVPPSQAGLCVS